MAIFRLKMGHLLIPCVQLDIIVLKVLKNSWKLRSDQDGGSGGHRSGQGWAQVREKATGDLLVFVFVNKISLKLSLFCESKSFLTTFCVVLY